jgi:hypothetical protein
VLSLGFFNAAADCAKLCRPAAQVPPCEDGFAQ